MRFIPVFAMATLLAVANPVSGQDAADEVVVKLGATEIRISELRKILDAQPREVREQLAQSAPAIDRLVRTEVFRRTLLAEARVKGWDKRPEVITLMDRAREQALLSSYMNEIAKPPASYPSEQELTEVYNANQAEFAVPRQFRVAQIFVSVPKDAPKADGDRLRLKAEDLAKRAQPKDADFAKIAQASSDHKPSANQGGDLGWLNEKEMITEVRTQVALMVKGDVSKPLRTEHGWHIVKLLDTKPESIRPLADVRAQLIPVLRQRRAQEIERKYLDDLVDKTPLAVNEIALGKLRATLGKP
ncbi:MAG: peptidylprolyl isomerase [Burkholderiales bacterium]